jgi:hypothetical protein
MDAGIAGVELGSLSLFRLTAPTGAAHDDRDVIWRMVLDEIALLCGLPGSDDGELGVAVSGRNRAGGKVLEWIKVLDPRSLSEAQALSFAGRFRIRRERRDPCGSREKGATKVFDGAADGGDASETGHYNAIHLIFLAEDCFIVC